MRNLSINIKLLIVFIIFLVGFILTNFYFVTTKERSYKQEMLAAVKLTKEWFRIVQQQKEIRGIHTDAISNVPNKYLLGDDFTMSTTTLGSLNAKEISTNPDFSALIVRLLKTATIEEGKTIGVIASGSFPALTISTLAALQTLKMNVVLMSSLGASSYGANQAEATWLDIENWLIKKGNLKFRSQLVSKGAENDVGLGLTVEGNVILENAGKRNNRTLYTPENLLQSITDRVQLFCSNNIDLLINIGGNQAAMGSCTHSVSIPNGLNKNIQLCDDKYRGVIQEINSKGIPIIHLLNIKDLASRYMLDLSPGIEYSESTNLYTKIKNNTIANSIILFLELLSIVILLSNKLKNADTSLSKHIV